MAGCSNLGTDDSYYVKPFIGQGAYFIGYSL